MRTDFQHKFHGTIRLVFLEWTGTYDCYATCEAFDELFKRWGVEINIEQIQIPMRLGKRRHIEVI